MRAGCADREKVIAPARDQHRLVAHVPAEHAAVGDLVERHTLGEIRTLRLRLLGGHGLLLCGDQGIGCDNCTVGSPKTEPRSNSRGAASFLAHIPAEPALGLDPRGGRRFADKNIADE